MRFCGLYNREKEIQPIKAVEVKCTVREDFAMQVQLTQTFQLAPPKAISVEVIDADGDKLEIQKNGNNIALLVNGKMSLRRVTQFAFDCNTGRYEDNSGNGIIPATDRLLFARKLVWLFEQAKKSHFLDIQNEPEGGLRALSPAEVPKCLVETSYYFPLDGNAAVYAFKATLEDGSVINGIVQEKKQAQQTYKTAKKQGKTAFLMEREKSDIFQITLGNINAGEQVKIEISYIAELEMKDGKIRVRIPNRIAPKCGGGPSTNVNYPITFNFAIRTSTAIQDVEALGGVDINIERPPGDERYILVLASKEGYMNEDLVLMVGQKCPYGVYSTLERSHTTGSECLRLTFNNPVSTDMDMDGSAEIIFLVDKSGSMSGGRMKTTKFALSLFLRSLPENSKFNIVAFDSRWNTCFKESQAYNDKTMADAQRYVDRINASGGTNISQPLESVLKQEMDDEFPRSVILLTDGEVRDTQSCIEAARCGGCRIFTIGVGQSFSQELVEGIATASNGSWQAVHDNNDMGNVVMQTLGNILKPSICKCSFDLGPFAGAEMWPSKIPQIMDGVRTTIYFTRPFTGEGDVLPGQFEIKMSGFYNNGDKFEKELNVITGDFEGITESQLYRSKQEVDTIIHRVAALSKVKKLERGRSGKRQEDEILQLGLKYNIATSQTSFVAVHEVASGDSTNNSVLVGEYNQPEERFHYESYQPRMASASKFGGSASRSGGFGGVGALFGSSAAPSRSSKSIQIQSNYASFSNYHSLSYDSAPPQRSKKMSKSRPRSVKHRQQNFAAKQELFCDSIELEDDCDEEEEELDNLMAEESVDVFSMLSSAAPAAPLAFIKKQAEQDDFFSFESSPAQASVSLEFNWLMSQQAASGKFNCSSNDSRFAKYRNDKVIADLKARLKDQSVLNEVLATLFALAALKDQFKSRQTEWQFIFAKGQRWVKKQLSNPEEISEVLAMI